MLSSGRGRETDAGAGRSQPRDMADRCRAPPYGHAWFAPAGQPRKFLCLFSHWPQRRLRLQDCAHTTIGSSLARGISGGGVHGGEAGIAVHKHCPVCANVPAPQLPNLRIWLRPLPPFAPHPTLLCRGQTRFSWNFHDYLSRAAAVRRAHQRTGLVEPARSGGGCADMVEGGLRVGGVAGTQGPSTSARKLLQRVQGRPVQPMSEPP